MGTYRFYGHQALVVMGVLGVSMPIPSARSDLPLAQIFRSNPSALIFLPGLPAAEIRCPDAPAPRRARGAVLHDE